MTWFPMESQLSNESEVHDENPVPQIPCAQAGLRESFLVSAISHAGVMQRYLDRLPSNVLLCGKPLCSVGHGSNMVGSDIMEQSPHYDPSGVSAVVAAKVVRELTIIVSQHTSKTPQ